MAGVDLAGGAGLGAHRQGLGEGAAAVEADAAQQLAVGDAGGGEEHVVAPDQVVDVQDLLQVVAGVEGGLGARRRCVATAGRTWPRRGT